MNPNIHHQIHYVGETIALLQHLGSGETYPEMRKHLERCHQIEFGERENKVWELLGTIEGAALKELQGEKDCLMFYFANTETRQEESLGRLLLLWDWYGLKEYADMESLYSYLTDIGEQEYANAFGKFLYLYNSRTRDDAEVPTFKNTIDVIRFLMGMELSEHEKLLIQDVLINRTEHLDRIRTVLDITYQVIQQYRNLLQEAVDVCALYWENKLKNKTYPQYALEALNDTFEENPLGWNLSFCIFHPARMGITVDFDTVTGEYTMPCYGKAGLLLGDCYTIPMINHKESISEEYAKKVLRLMGDKNKLEIMLTVLEHPCYGQELARKLNLTPATMSYHLSALTDERVLCVKKKNQKIYYYLERESIVQVLRYWIKRLEKTE